MAVLHPLKVTIENYPEGESELLTVEINPNDESAGTKEISFSKNIYIEQDDFMEVPAPKYKRMYPGNEVRLKGAYLVKCTGCVKDGDGNVTEILCEYDPESRGGDPADGRKVKGAPLHWVDAATALRCCAAARSRNAAPRCPCPRRAEIPPVCSSCVRATSAWTTATAPPAASSLTDPSR